mgnify:CR=1 FL=1
MVVSTVVLLVAVGLSLLIGVPLGIVAGLSDRFQRGVTPVLDAMQIIPAFAYLMPIVILFSVGPGAAVITTMIYAVPPASPAQPLLIVFHGNGLDFIVRTRAHPSSASRAAPESPT